MDWGADSRGMRMARNASTHHDMLICFAWTEKRWGGVEMHWFAMGLRWVLDPLFLGSRFRFPLDSRLCLVALFLPFIRGFDSSRIPLLADMFYRQFAQIGDRETIRVSRRG